MDNKDIKTLLKVYIVLVILILVLFIVNLFYISQIVGKVNHVDNKVTSIESQLNELELLNIEY